MQYQRTAAFHFVEMHRLQHLKMARPSERNHAREALRSDSETLAEHDSRETPEHISSNVNNIVASVNIFNEHPTI
jgi:hypothetical protein